MCLCSGGSPAGSITGCGPENVQCGDEFQLAERPSDGSVVGVSRHPGGPAFAVSHDGGATFPGGFTIISSLKTGSCQQSLLATTLSSPSVLSQHEVRGKPLLAAALLLAAPRSVAWNDLAISISDSGMLCRCLADCSHFCMKCECAESV